MTDIEMLPLPEALHEVYIGGRPWQEAPSYADVQMKAYARAVAEHNVKTLREEMKMLRAMIGLPEGVAPSDAPRAITRAEEWCRKYLDEKARAEQLQEELDKQLRLHSIGTERELSLMTERNAAIKRADSMEAERDRMAIGGGRLAAALEQEGERAERLAEALRGCRDMLRESAKQHRLAGDDGHAIHCQTHVGVADATLRDHDQEDPK